MFSKSVMKFGMLAMFFGLMISGALQAASDQKPHNIVFQVIDNDPGLWKQTLNIAKNLKKDMGHENLAIEIVTHGGGLDMILKDTEVAGLLADVQKDGVVLAACAATMKMRKFTEKDLYQGVQVVPFGVKEIMTKQEAGWTYIRM